LFNAGEPDFVLFGLRGLLTNWLIVGIDFFLLSKGVLIPHIQVVHFLGKNKAFVLFAQKLASSIR
jgi:hypothetical protein